MNLHGAFFYIRMASPADAQECHEIDVEAWGQDSAAPVDMLLARIDRYPFGNFVAVENSTNQIIGSVWTVAIDDKPITTWWETTGGGIYDGCNVHGDLLVGVNVSVRQAYMGRFVGEQLVIRAGEVAWAAGKRKAVLGSRIPEYHKWQQAVSAEDYIRLYLAGDQVFFHDVQVPIMRAGPSKDKLRNLSGPIDPRTWPVANPAGLNLRVFDAELAFFSTIKISNRRPHIYQLLPGYFPDGESCDNGVLIGWENEKHPAWDPDGA